MEEPYGTIFVSMPTMLDKTVAPKDRHIVHAFTPCWIEEWEVRIGSPLPGTLTRLLVNLKFVCLLVAIVFIHSHFRSGCCFQC
jgi:hypothetical protein